MEKIAYDIITQFGALGVIIIIGIYFIWHTNRGDKRLKNDSVFVQSNNEKLDIVIENQKLLSQRIECVESRLDEKINILSEKITNQPQELVQHIKTTNHQDMMKAPDNMIKQIYISPIIHKILRKYKDIVGCDHIFYANFHNGTKSITGMPYYKFDIVSERFSPDIESDGEFAPFYQNVDITRHDKLPQILLQEQCVYCSVDENGDSPMSEWDYIIHCRMIGRGIKQLALVLLNDSNHKPIGFVGAIKYDDIKLDVDELKRCGNELELMYEKNTFN